MPAVFSYRSRSFARPLWAVATLAATLLAGVAQAQTPGPAFDFDTVTRIARERAEKPY